jgi:FixJ family two-component response regulator
VQREATADPLVFVLDDDAIVGEGLKALFGSVGFRCEVFGSPVEFLTRPPPEVVSCLVLDVRLPGLSGLAVQAQLAEAQINIPVVFITGYGDVPMTVKAMKAGAFEFLTKPIREQDLLDAVRGALERDRMRRQHEDMRRRVETLSARQREVVALLAAGLRNKQVVADLGVTDITVKAHRRRAMEKLGLRTLADLVRTAYAFGISRNQQSSDR